LSVLGGVVRGGALCGIADRDRTPPEGRIIALLD
jgi:hypothetical protein